MKQVYSDILLLTGIHKAGIVKLQIAPIEWLAADPEIDFNTGAILNQVSLINGYTWLEIELTPQSKDFEENFKITKSGSYYEIYIKGLLNHYSAALRQQLETLRYNLNAVILTDRKKQKYFIGDTQNGMVIRPSHKIITSPAGEETIALEIFTESECPAPFYTGDGSAPVPDQSLLIDFDNVILVDSDGGALIVI